MKTIHSLSLQLTLALAACLPPAHGQLIIPDVTIDTQRIPLEAHARQDSTALDSLLTLYVGDSRREWNRDNEQYDLPIQVNIYFTDYVLQ